MATVTFIKYQKQSAGSLRGVAQYVSQDEKTLDENGSQLISGQNCTPQLVSQEFQATRDMCHKESPVWFYHYVQSFSPDEVITGEQAHQLAKEFAAKAWPDSEVLIATHLDAEHIHTHFIVNAVCWETGKMLRQGPNTLRSLRQLSDELCLKHGFSVLPQQKKKQSQGMGTREYRSAAKGESWKFRLMNTIDQCMQFAASKEEFISLMESEGYQVRWTASRKNITYTTPQGMKCRDDRLHELKYTKDVSSESERRLSTEELKRLNQPQEMKSSTASPPPMVLLPATDWNMLLTRLDRLEAGVSAQEALLRALSQQVGQLPTREQTETLAREVSQMRADLKQAGKKKELSISPPSLRTALSVSIWLALILLATMVGMVVLQTIWSGLAALWKVVRTLFL